MLPAATPNEISQLVYGLALDWRIGSGFQKKGILRDLRRAWGLEGVKAGLCKK